MFFFASTSLTSLVFGLMSMGFCGWAMSNNAANKDIKNQLLGLMLSVSCSSSLGMVAVLYPYLDSSDNVAAKQESIEEIEPSNSSKSLPLYLDVLHKQASQAFGDELVTLFQEESRYVVVKKIDLIKSEKSKGLIKLAKSDCNQVLKVAGSRRIDIRYIDVGGASIKDFDCDLLAELERNRHIRLKR